MASRGRILVLWNQTEEDIYERWRTEGPKPLAWDATRMAPDVGTVQEELDAMLEGLREGGFEVHCVNVEDDIDRLMGAIRFYRPDAVFNLMEYFNDDSSQEAYVVGLYELLGVPYTGCPGRCLSICQDKYRTKALLAAAELPTAEYMRVTAEPVTDPEEYELSYPLIVKPSLEDASGGIEAASVVHTFEQLEERVRFMLREFEQPLVVEEYIEGREIHAAILGNNPPQVLPLFEMEFDDSEFNPEGEWRPQIISFKAKWDPHSEMFYSMDAVVPAQDLDEEIEARIREVAVQAFLALECRDYARIDMRVDEDEGEVYILEVNPNPDLADGAAYMQCATASGRSFSETLCEIADMAVLRGRDWEQKLAGRGEPPMDHLLREYTRRAQEEAAGKKGGADARGAAASGSEVAAVRLAAESVDEGADENEGDDEDEGAEAGEWEYDEVEEDEELAEDDEVEEDLGGEDADEDLGGEDSGEIDLAGAAWPSDGKSIAQSEQGGAAARPEGAGGGAEKASWEASWSQTEPVADEARTGQPSRRRQSRSRRSGGGAGEDNR